MDKRGFDRLRPAYIVIADAQIYKYKDKQILSRSTKVTLRDYSLKGLCFSSSLNFPVSNEVILSVEFTLFGKKIKVKGNIVWKIGSQHDYIYGFEIISANLFYHQLVNDLTGQKGID